MSDRETEVRCPRCQGLFPHSEVELHIAEMHTSRHLEMLAMRAAYLFLAAAYVFLAAAFTTLVLLYQRAR